MNLFLNNVVVGSWQIISPIVMIVFLVVSYRFSKFFREHLLFIYTLFLMVFIPLYPKIPLQGIRNTFVYIRLDDIAVGIGVLLWLFYVLRHKASLRTPLTKPIFLYWGIGLISTIVAIIFIFPTLANVFPSSAILYFLRHIEYLIVFFLAFSSMRKKEYIPWTIGVLTATLLLVSGYGIGQRFFPSHFLAYSTMNEQFAKGIPLILSSAGRIQATFAGHYDLAAYLVMMIPLVGSLIFGLKKFYLKIGFLLTIILSLVVLLMTASRTSFAVYLAAICFVLVLQKKKILIIPVIILSLLLMREFSGISNRFDATLTQVPLAIDANTGKAIGEVQTGANGKLTIENVQSTGENLPQGTGYIVPVTSQSNQSATQITYRSNVLKAGSRSAQLTDLRGNFVIKQAIAYDVSFTTRLQGEWPRALEAFNREPLLGSGYSSISLASDNNYLRMLGETGILGFAAFFLIFIMASIYAVRILPDVTSPIARSFVIGTMGGIFGLALNAILIDVFEASKVAYYLWGLLGLTVGILALYQKKPVNFKHDLRVLVSSPALIIYFLAAAFTLFAMMLNSFFVADDFTWLRWVADCKKVVSHGVSSCQPLGVTLLGYFRDAGGFFYRPAEKVYFYFMYSFAGLSPVSYHVFSLILHWACTVLVYLLTKRILKNKLFAVTAGIFFLVLSSHEETIFWISSTQHLFVAFFTLLAVWLFDLYMQKKNVYYFFLSLISVLLAPMFHESGIVAGVLVIAYSLIMYGPDTKNWLRSILQKLILLLSIPITLYLRTIANSLWSTTDYSYRLSKLPFNFFGNLLGYILVTVLGVYFEQTYAVLRLLGKSNILVVSLIILVALALLGIGGYFLNKRLTGEAKRILWICLAFFIIPLLPFLGLGNLTSRYVYLASFGEVLFFTFIIMKAYGYIIRKSVYLGYVLLFMLVFAYSYFQYSQLVKVNQDWVDAGNITYNLLQDLSSEYQLPGSIPPSPVFYFNNVPTKTGLAWVFPDGLNDAIWLTFQDSNVVVKNTSSLAVSMKEGSGTTSARFYEFKDNKNITETVPTAILITPTVSPGAGK